jgi:hypothetical protein
MVSVNSQIEGFDHATFGRHVFGFDHDLDFSEKRSHCFLGVVGGVSYRGIVVCSEKSTHQDRQARASYFFRTSLRRFFGLHAGT